MGKSEKQKKHLEKLNLNQKRENNRNWKGGRIRSGGYIRLSGKFDCPYLRKGDTVLEQYYVWWKHYGIQNPILRGELLHHKNENKTDNRIENLEKMEWNNHAKFHNGGHPRR